MGFTEAWAKTGAVEKGYVNNPKDRGGPTNHGVTEVVARAWGYTGDMKDLPEELAIKIAKAQYWDPMKLDELSSVSQRIAEELFDSGYLHGPGKAAQWLQESLNELNRNGQDYGELKVDFSIGMVTLGRLKDYLKKRAAMDGELVMLKSLNVKQGAFMQAIVKNDTTQEEFLFGWLRSRVVI